MWCFKLKEKMANKKVYKLALFFLLLMLFLFLCLYLPYIRIIFLTDKTFLRMKKLFILMAMVAFVFTSCKKDYTCTCTSDTTGVDPIVYNYDNFKKSDAEDACDALNNVAGVTCVLD